MPIAVTVPGSTAPLRGRYDMGMFRTDSILPPDPEGLEVLHDREYRVRAYRVSDDELLIRGAVRDQKPPGLYLADDPEPLTMHHMQVDLHVAFPSAEIIAAEVVFESHPHTTCPTITGHYQGLVGLSISRGYTHKVRDLFGGPRGCTHTTALLLAMGPIAVQCFWSMHASTARRDATAFAVAADDLAGAAGDDVAVQPQHVPRLGRGRRAGRRAAGRPADRGDADPAQALRGARHPRVPVADPRRLTEV